MSQIIVGIDFSTSSLIALKLAVDIANRTGADILMAWVETKEKDLEEAKQELNKLATDYKSKLNGKNISYIICQGKVYQAIAKLVIECASPVLIVRETFNFDKHLEKIILPIDSSRDTRQKVPWTIEFAKMFPQSHICILGVQTSNIKSVRNEVRGFVLSVEKFLTQHKLPFTTEFVDTENITTATLDYAKNINADLIVTMVEQEKTITNFLFLGPYSQQMINLSPFPVLIIPNVQLHGAAK